MLVSCRLCKKKGISVQPQRTMSVLSFHRDSQGFGEDVPPTCTSLWLCHPKTKKTTIHIGASRAGIALQGLPGLKSKDVSDEETLSPHSFVALDNVPNLANPFIFTFTKGQVSSACRIHAALDLSHILYFVKRSPEQSVMVTDLDLYYKRQRYQAKVMRWMAEGCVTTIYVNGCAKRTDLRILPQAPQQFSLRATLLLQSLNASQWRSIWM